jgi:hypothetical protein
MVHVDEKVVTPGNQRRKFTLPSSLAVHLFLLVTVVDRCHATTRNGACLSHMALADRDEDSKLNKLEYTKFVNDMSGGAFRDFFLIAFDDLPPSLQTNFKAFACHCPLDESQQCCPDDSNSQTIDIQGVHSRESWSELQYDWLERICDDTETALGSGSSVGIQVADLTRQAPLENPYAASTSDPAYRSTFNLDRQASPAPTPSTGVCYVSLLRADDNGDSNLTETEFVSFLNFLTNEKWLGLGFAQLPSGLQQVYSSRSIAGSINLQGARPGQSATSSNTAYLREFCSATFLAINTELNGQENGSTIAPTASPTETLLSLASPNSAAVETTPGPTIALNLCFVAMTINDRDGNEFLDQTEYVLFCNQISSGKFSGIQFDSLAAPLKDKFVDLSNGSSDGINVQGTRPNSSPDSAQSNFLERVCLEVDRAVDQALNPVPTLAPSAPTGAVTSPLPTPKETFSSETASPAPVVSESFPTRLSILTRPPFGFTTPQPISSGSTGPESVPSLRVPTPAPISETSAPITGITTTPAPTTTTPAPIKTTPAPIAKTPSPTPLSGRPIFETDAPSRSPKTRTPTTLRPTKSPTVRSSRSPTKSVSQPPVSSAPSDHREGIRYYGNVTFKISNSARLDQDNLISGKTRYQLTQAFTNLAQNVTAQAFLVDRRLRHGRHLLLHYSEGKIDQINDTDCPAEVPTNTICCECYASFAIETFDESSSSAQTEAKKIESILMAAITNGELQQELDAINPDTPVRIEEGQVRQRDDPAGVYTVAGTSVSTTVIYVVAAAVGLLVLVCLWWKCGGTCCTKGSKYGPPKTDPSSVAEAPKEQRNSKKQGWFG